MKTKLAVWLRKWSEAFYYASQVVRETRRGMLCGWIEKLTQRKHGIFLIMLQAKSI
jgi:hypothetical protein